MVTLEDKGIIAKVTYVFNGQERVDYVTRCTRTWKGYTTEKGLNKAIKERVTDLLRWHTGAVVLTIERIETKVVGTSLGPIDPSTLQL